MSHKQKHRGQNSKDPELFHENVLPILNQAVYDLSWLRSRGYADKSGLKLVGDRYKLKQRQRKALYRAYCTDHAQESRASKELSLREVRGKKLAIDGYNLLISIESGLAGGLVFNCRDGTYRDIASIHGTYRRVEETLPALKLIGKSIKDLGIESSHWFLDQPISNSGRLRHMMLEIAQAHEFTWEIDLVNNPDKAIAELEGHVAISSDGWILDESESWFNLNRYIIDQLPEANVLDLRGIEQPS
ncbi:MAG: DUF434 domain-containing protein [Bacteroidota bacterium]